MSRLTKFLIFALSLAMLTMLFIMLFLPSLLRSKAAEVVNKSYGRTLVIRELSLNPFSWTIEARGISLSEKRSNVVFFACSSVRTKISPASLFHRAPILSAMDLVSPYLHLVRNDGVTYNFSDLIPAGKRGADEKPARFSLNNIWLKGGTIEFTDRLIPHGEDQTVRGLEVRVPFFSTLPYLADSYITPGISAAVDGARFSLEGKLKPFAREAEVMIRVKLNDLDLARFASYLPATVPVRLSSGKLTTDLKITHRAVAKGEPDFTMTGLAGISDLDLKDRRRQPLFSLSRGSVRIREARILAGVYDLDSLELVGPKLHLTRNRQGVLNLPGSAAASDAADAPRPGQKKTREAVTQEMKKQKKEGMIVSVAKVTVHEGEIQFMDHLPPGGFTVELNAIALAVNGFSTGPDKSANYTLTFASNRKERFDLAGAFSLAPVATATKVRFSGLQLGAAYPYLTDFLTSPVSGVLDGTAAVTFSKDSGAQVADLALSLKKLAVGFGEKDGIRVPELTLKGGAVDLKGGRAVVESIAVKGGSVDFSRAADGKLSPLSLLRPQPSPPVAPKSRQPRSTPFRYAVNSVNVVGLDLSFTDYQNRAAPSFALKKAALSLGNFSGPESNRMPFTFSGGFNGGSLASAGSLTLDPLRITGNCNVKGIPITAFDAYFPAELHLIIADGILDADLSAALTVAAGGVKGNFQGEVTVSRFHSLDDVEGDDLVKWENLHLGGISGTVTPFSLNLARVALTDYFARITVEKDSTLNLQKLYLAPPTQTLVSPTVGQSASNGSPADPSAPPVGKIAIQAVTLQDGTIVFSDHHIKPEFTATMYKLGGKIDGLSSEQMKFADLDLRGNLLNQSPLRITGKINPLRGDLFVDMKVSFGDIELSPMTPYAGTYLGYMVDKGKLYLDLMYHIENKQLTSENRLFIDQLTFGDRVQSDRATKLPVRLAIALLKDSRGEIHLDLPVTGRIDDPKFSVWKVIGQILMNLVEKAATAPFKLLGALLGGEDNFNSVTFTPGSVELAADEQKKLTKLGKLIANRPELNLEVRGYVDKELDTEGYRHELLRKKMRNEKFLALVKEKRNLPGQTAEEMIISSEESGVWLRAVYGREKFPKPRTVIGLVKDLPDSEMKKLIFANTTVGDEELAQLVRARVVAVKNYLVSAAGVSRERVFEKSGALWDSPREAGSPASRVEFGLAAR